MRVLVEKMEFLEFSIFYFFYFFYQIYYKGVLLSQYCGDKR